MLIFIKFLIYLRFLYELFTKTSIFLNFQKHWIRCSGGEIVKRCFSFGRVLLVCVVYATKKTRCKMHKRREREGGRRGRGGREEGRGERGGGGRAKAKKIRANAKKINPPYQKNSDFVLACHSLRCIYYPNTLCI